MARQHRTDCGGMGWRNRKSLKLDIKTNRLRHAITDSLEFISTLSFHMGQLYVALSRATDCRQIFISLSPTTDGTLTTDDIDSEVFPTGI